MSRGEKSWFSSLAVLAVVLLLLLLNSCGDDCSDKEPTTKVTVTATVTATPSPAGSQIGETLATAREQVQRTGLSIAVHDASDQDETPASSWTVCFEKATLSKVDFAAVPQGAPCPKKDGGRIPWPKMLNVEGTTYARAVEKLGDRAGDVAIVAAYEDELAYDANNRSGDYANWKVCFQSIKAGKPLEAEPGIILHAVENGDACPSAKGLYKDPTNDPDYVAPDPGPEADPDVGSSEDDDSSSGGSGSSEEDYYPGDKGGCPPGGCYNPCPPGGCR